jgi:serine protease AprX
MRLSRFRCSLLAFAVLLSVGPPAHAQLIGGGTIFPPPLPALTPILSKLDPLMQARLSNSGGRSRVIVRAQSASAVSAVALLIQLNGGTLGRTLPILQAIVADVPNASLAILTNSTLVRRVAFDRPVVPFNERTGATIGAASARQQYGYDGSGVGVAIIDSGVTSWHDDLSSAASPSSQRVVQFVDFVQSAATPYDDHGHGTHVAGIVAGNGFDSSGRRSGIAPGADLVVLKVLDGAGRGTISDVIAALDYVVQHRDEYRIRVVNLSIGAMVHESSQSDFLTLAAKSAVQAGLIVVAAAGNSGKDSLGRTRYGGITAPGNAPWVLTVGAASHMGTIDRSDDTVAAFSSRGPTAFDFLSKPDLLAPGVGIESLSAPGSHLYNAKPQLLLPGTVVSPSLPYLSLTGTSQAAPVISGTIALMLQANPALTPNAVKAILQYTAQARSDYDALTQGAGFVNAQAAIELARHLAAPGTEFPATTAWNGFLIWGNQRIHDGRLTASANGWSSNVIWGAVQTPGGANVEWGTICSGAACELPTSWTPWRTSCVDPACLIVNWGGGRSENVVFGTNCGGGDCSVSNFDELSLWVVTAAADDGDTVVWGTGEDDTVVWGTGENGDTVVWGTASDGDTVVWGTVSDGDTVVWGTSGGGDEDDDAWEESGTAPESQSVI